MLRSGLARLATRLPNFEIYVMNADGSNPVRLTDCRLEKAHMWQCSAASCR